MKKIIFFALLFLCSYNSQAQNFKLGLGGILQFADDPYGAFQGRATYDLNELYTISANANFHISDESNDWSQDFDVMYRLFSLEDVFVFSPFGGLNINNGIALNVGTNLSFDINEKSIYAAPKFVIDEKSHFAVSFGVLFHLGG